MDDHISAVRRFNRFYTRQIGLLDESLLQSEFSLTEVRVLFELAHRDGLTASDLGRDLDVDPGYLSRLLAKLEARGLLKRSPLEDDGRRVMLALTATGREAFAPLDQAAWDQIAGLLEPLSATDRGKLVRAMETVQRLLGGSQEPLVPYILRDLQPGDLGWVIHRQGIVYNEEYGWDETFEALVTEIAGAFAKNV